MEDLELYDREMRRAELPDATDRSFKRPPLQPQFLLRKESLQHQEAADSSTNPETSKQ